MGWIGWVRCKKFRCDFVARTFALNAPVQPVLHRVSCSNEMIQNAPKQSKHINTCIWGPMGWIGCDHYEIFRCDFRAQTCALIAPVQPILHRVSCSNKTFAKCTQTLRNTPKHEFRVQLGGSGAFVAKNSNATSC